MKRSSLIAFSISPIAVSAIGFIFTPILAWWLSEDEMAKMAIFQTNSNFFVLLVSLGLDQAIVREFYEIADRGKLLKQVLQLVFLAIPIGLLGLVIFEANSSGVAKASVTAPMAAVCVLMLLNRIYSTFIRMSGDGVAYSFDIVTPKLLQLLAVALIGSQSILIPTYDLVISIFLVSTACALCYEIIMSARIVRRLYADNEDKKRNDGLHYINLLKFSVPLVPGALAYYAISASAIYVVSAIADSRQVVITSLSLSIGGGVAVLQSVFATLWAPFAYRWHAEDGSHALYGCIATIVTMGCSVLLLASFFVAPCLVLLLPEKYTELSRLVVLVIAWNLLYLISIVGSFGIGVKRMSFTSMTISIIGAALSIGMSIVASHYFAAHGALLAVLGALIVTLIFNCELSARRWQRVVALPHYVMVGIISISGVLFSFSLEWQAQLLLAVSIILYLPSFRNGVIQANVLHKSRGI